MFVSHKALNRRHLATNFCYRGEERKRCRLAEEDKWAGAELASTAYGISLAPVTSFKYLGRFILAVDDNLPAVVHNLQRAQKKWAQLTWVLSREGTDALTLVKIYLVVVQLVMLHGLKVWVMIPRIRSVLGRFHHKVARNLTRGKPLIGQDVVWVYLLP